MEAFFTFILTCLAVLIIHWYDDAVLSAMEYISDYFFGWSVQHITIDKVLELTKYCLYVTQSSLVIIELVGFIGFVRAINMRNYTFPIIVMWIGLAEKIGSLLTEKKHKQIYLLTTTSFKLGLAIYFDNSLNVFANTCKLIILLFLEHILTKIKYIFLKQGFFAMISNTDINENSLQSIIVKIFSDTYTRLNNLNATTIELKHSLNLLCEQVSDIVKQIDVGTNCFVIEVSKVTNKLYKLKLFGMILVFCFLDYTDISNIFVFYSILAKVCEFVFGSVTAVNSMLDNAFDILKKKCSDIRTACVAVKAGICLASIGQKRYSS